MKTRGVVLDAGAFVALEKRNRVMVALAKRLLDSETPMVTSAGVVAQVWRGGGERQVALAFLLRKTQVVDLTFANAKLIGRMLGLTKTRDPIDAHIAYLARERGWAVLTSDPDDILKIDPSLQVERI